MRHERLNQLEQEARALPVSPIPPPPPRSRTGDRARIAARLQGEALALEELAARVRRAAERIDHG